MWHLFDMNVCIDKFDTNNICLCKTRIITYYVCYILTSEIYRVDQSHRRQGESKLSMRLVNPIYLCSQSVANL